jgi:hypothetical protein
MNGSKKLGLSLAFTLSLVGGCTGRNKAFPRQPSAPEPMAGPDNGNTLNQPVPKKGAG